jgi:hypothetical protein
MSIKVGLEELYQNSHNGAFQSFRPVKALMLYSQRRNSIMENESFNRKINLPSSNWSNSSSQNIELKLTVSRSVKYITKSLYYKVKIDIISSYYLI